MASLPSVSKLQVEESVFSPTVKPPGASNTLFLAGAGARGLNVEGRFVNFTAIGVYLGEEAVASLEGRWKGKTSDELAECVDFYRDIVTGRFEKFTKVRMILPLTGQQYSEKVTENCVAYWKAVGIYTQAEAMAVEKFKQVFKDETFPPGSAILFTHSPSGSLTITLSKDGTIVPEESNAVIENKTLCEAVLESIIGQHGVSPAAKRSMAERLSEILKEANGQDTHTEAGAETVEAEGRSVGEAVSKKGDGKTTKQVEVGVCN